MEDQPPTVVSSHPRVSATLRLGSEAYIVNANKGILSDQLVLMKEESINILKDFITKHNVPNDVPDESDEVSSEDGGDIPERSKKRK